MLGRAFRVFHLALACLLALTAIGVGALDAATRSMHIAEEYGPRSLEGAYPDGPSWHARYEVGYGEFAGCLTSVPEWSAGEDNQISSLQGIRQFEPRCGELGPWALLRKKSFWTTSGTRMEHMGNSLFGDPIPAVFLSLGTNPKLSDGLERYVPLKERRVRNWCVGFRLLYLAAILGAYPTILALRFVGRRLRDRHRRTIGLCSVCGYDLRACTSGICTECGTPFVKCERTIGTDVEPE